MVVWRGGRTSWSGWEEFCDVCYSDGPSRWKGGKKKWTYVHTFPPCIWELYARCTPRANSRPMRTDRKHCDKGDKIHTTCLKWLLPSKVDSKKKREWTISTTSQYLIRSFFFFPWAPKRWQYILFAFSLFFFSVSMDKKSHCLQGHSSLRILCVFLFNCLRPAEESACCKERDTELTFLLAFVTISIASLIVQQAHR